MRERKRERLKSWVGVLELNDTTFPSAVTAAKTVAEYGDHATSPTTLLRS